MISHINLYFKTVLFFGLFVLFSGHLPAFCGQDAPPVSGKEAVQGSPKESDSKGNLGSWAVSFYVNYISAVDGDRCPSVPSCASYSKAAFKKHGFFLGWMMTVDRLIHEPDEASVSAVVYDKDGVKVFDPVENNDFWWFREGESTKQ